MLRKYSMQAYWETPHGLTLKVNYIRKPYGPSVTFSAMNERHLAKAFKQADLNGDGLLDLEEYIQYYKAQGVTITKEEGQVLLKGKDKDHDDLISYEEFIGKTTDAEKAWNALDTSKKGFLTQLEIRNGVKKYKKSLPSVISRNTGTNPNAFFDM